MNTKYGHKAGWVEKAIVVFFILWGMATICKVAGAEPTLCITPPSKGILMVGVKHPPTGKRVALMVSHDLKTWSIAKDAQGIKCVRAFPSHQDMEGKTTWWHIAISDGLYITNKVAIYKLSR